jgi:hypothetical protein
MRLDRAGEGGNLSGSEGVLGLCYDTLPTGRVSAFAAQHAPDIHEPNGSRAMRLAQIDPQTNTNLRDTRDIRDTLNFPLLA